MPLPHRKASTVRPEKKNAPVAVVTHAHPAPLPRAGVSYVLRSPLFWGGLAVKLVLGSVLASHFLRELFTPFVNYFWESGFQNPWAHFYAMGRADSFPYPPLMLYLLTFFRAVFSPLLPQGTDAVTAMHLFVMRLPLLCCDLAVLGMLLAWFPTKARRVLALYWCSPIVLWVCYAYGQLDIIPTALFTFSLFLMHTGHFTWAGAAFGCAAATKSHILAAVPILVIYVFYERRWKGVFRAFLAGTLAYALWVTPYLSDPAFLKMVFGTGEQLRLFALRVPFGNYGYSILLGPAAILALWGRFALYPKWNWDLFMLYLGLLFSAFVLLSAPAPGYFIWSLPFLVFFYCRMPRARTTLYGCYVFFYILFYVFGDPSELVSVWGKAGFSQSDLIFTCLQLSLIGTIYSMYAFGVRSNSVYRLRTTPVLIGLAGDSGAGKDRFVDLVKDLLGEGRVTVTSGDDYHRWPRGHAKWKEYTHLDLRGNDLYSELEHARALASGAVIAKRSYDHTTGQFLPEKAVDPKGYLIFSGLHSLSLESMRRLYDLSVFLDPDESLRKEWKIERDGRERNYSRNEVLAQLAKREADRKKFILPQRDHAHLIFRYFPLSSGELGLIARARNSFNWIALAEVLQSEGGLSVQHDPFVDSQWQELNITGKVSDTLCQDLASRFIPNLDEIARTPRFRTGLEGVVALLFLSCLSQSMRWRGERHDDRLPQ